MAPPCPHQPPSFSPPAAGGELLNAEPQATVPANVIVSSGSRLNEPMSTPPNATAPRPAVEWPVILRGLAGAAAGGLAGYLLFWWLRKQGFYSIMLPGVLLGFGASLTARGRSQILGVICLLAGIALMIYAEWTMAPFIANPSFTYFITHLHQLRPVTLLLMAFGAAGAWWFGQGR